MLKWYHRAITARALQDCFSQRALRAICAANLGQDRFDLQVKHPEFHIYASTFAQAAAYAESQRALVVASLEAGEPRAAWKAFGRLSHVTQDFYAHSNYVSLWLGRFPDGHWPPPETIDPLDHSLLVSPDLVSGKVYRLFEVLSYLPAVKRLVIPRLPHDSHAWMNLDAPWRGAKVAYAFEAAVKRTRIEFEQVTSQLSAEPLALFLD